MKITGAVTIYLTITIPSLTVATVCCTTSFSLTVTFKSPTMPSWLGMSRPQECTSFGDVLSHNSQGDVNKCLPSPDWKALLLIDLSLPKMHCGMDDSS